MENSTGKEGYKSTIQVLLCTSRSSGKQWSFFSAVHFFFSITAILGNALILAALHRESSLHPPSKLLYRCLAVTDLLVGLITEPSMAFNHTFLITEGRLSDHCFYTAAIATVSFTIFSAVSLLTMTAISLDRLLALLLGLRYRLMVTQGRVQALVIFFWILSMSFASMSFWKYTIPKRVIQKDSVYCNMDSSYVSGLLFAIQSSDSCHYKLRIISSSWCHLAFNSNSCLFKFVFKLSSLLLEDQWSKARS